MEQSERDLPGLEKLVRKNGVKSCTWDDPGAQYRLGSMGLGSRLAGRDLGVLVGKKLNGSQQCATGAVKASSSLQPQ